MKNTKIYWWALIVGGHTVEVVKWKKNLFTKEWILQHTRPEISWEIKRVEIRILPAKKN